MAVTNSMRRCFSSWSFGSMVESVSMSMWKARSAGSRSTPSTSSHDGCCISSAARRDRGRRRGGLAGLLGLLLRLLGAMAISLLDLLLLAAGEQLHAGHLAEHVGAELGGDDLAHDPHEVAGEAGDFLLALPDPA
jgi:hypothetical protein